MARTIGGTVQFGVTPEVAFDYLVDPHNRPEWQSSLRRVEDVTDEPRVGQTWTDVTWPGVRPRMTTTALERAALWSESGTWRGVRADLTLRFEPTAGGCEVRYEFRIHALGPLGVVASVVSVPAVRADLKRAARTLGDRPA